MEIEVLGFWFSEEFVKGRFELRVTVHCTNGDMDAMCGNVLLWKDREELVETLKHMLISRNPELREARDAFYKQAK